MDDRGVMGLSVGVLGSIGVAGLLTSFRGEIDQTNVALALVLVVVVAAYTGGRAAGSLSGVVAAVSFDFFHTQPYRSLAIKSADDVWTTLLLVAVGLAVGQIATSRRVAKVAERAGTEEVAGIHRVTELSAGGAAGPEVVAAVEAEVAAVLRLRRCTFTTDPVDASLARMEPGGRVGGAPYVFQGDAFVLPADGVVIEVRHGERLLGSLVATPPSEPEGIDRDRRRTAVALADVLGLALAVAGAPDAAR
ncbi:DUF4118 domain-containing protein [Aquihabitans sp. G128]|uniref:DUF4118 domain-containing protein n=1 Tax=Aquihabitans sp. G128 TaxID=2849779 RepID=UPI001C23256D|nr:DUF4118 domain-containing protein [Aquihabitans sp. G128]QXC59798.1 DUF4118 domain-containing protein [Aquihabitans sp. G128]